MTIYAHDPDAVLDYRFDWSSWLADGETISSHTVTVSSGITLDSSTESDGIVTAWISGGTAGQRETVACRIVTSSGRADERTVTLSVTER